MRIFKIKRFSSDDGHNNRGLGRSLLFAPASGGGSLIGGYAGKQAAINAQRQGKDDYETLKEAGNTGGKVGAISGAALMGAAGVGVGMAGRGLIDKIPGKIASSAVKHLDPTGAAKYLPSGTFGFLNKTGLGKRVIGGKALGTLGVAGALTGALWGGIGGRAGARKNAETMIDRQRQSRQQNSSQEQQYYN